jgi:hypothetical protein
LPLSRDRIRFARGLQQNVYQRRNAATLLETHAQSEHSLLRLSIFRSHGVADFDHLVTEIANLAGFTLVQNTLRHTGKFHPDCR